VSGTDIHQLAAAYALDAVDYHERAEFEAHYPTCAICKAEVAGFRETLSQVAAATAVPPPSSLKARVMAEIGETRQLSPLLPASVIDLATHRQGRQRMVRMLTAAAVLVVIGIGAFVVGRQSGDDNGYAEAADAVLGQPDTRISPLEATGAAEGRFQVAWSPSANKIVVMGDDLPDPGPGKAYELWLVDDAGSHAVRLLDKADGRKVRRVLSVEGSPSQWAITVEPEEGVEKATTDIIFAGPA